MIKFPNWQIDLQAWRLSLVNNYILQLAKIQINSLYSEWLYPNPTN